MDSTRENKVRYTLTFKKGNKWKFSDLGVKYNHNQTKFQQLEQRNRDLGL